GIASLVAWAATTPIVLYHFHIVTPGSIVANVAASSLLWLALVSSMAFLAVAAASQALAAPLALAADGFAWALEAAIVRMAEVPQVAFYLPQVAAWQVVASYGALGLGCWALLALLARQATPPGSSDLRAAS